MYCSNCGKEFQERDMRFCPWCGKEQIYNSQNNSAQDSPESIAPRIINAESEMILMSPETCYKNVATSVLIINAIAFAMTMLGIYLIYKSTDTLFRRIDMTYLVSGGFLMLLSVILALFMPNTKTLKRIEQNCKAQSLSITNKRIYGTIKSNAFSIPYNEIAEINIRKRKVNLKEGVTTDSVMEVLINNEQKYIFDYYQNAESIAAMINMAKQEAN